MDRQQAKREINSLVSHSVYTKKDGKKCHQISLADVSRYMGKYRGYISATLNDKRKSNLQESTFANIHHAIFRYAAEYGYVFTGGNKNE